MSLTYTEDHARSYGEPPAAASHEPYVPVYARPRGRWTRRSGVRSWMILAPIGVLVLGGAAALMLTGDGAEGSSLVEPAATPPVLPAAAPAAAMGPSAPVVAPVEAAPLPRDNAPVARAAPARRAAPAPARRVEPTPAPVREPAVESEAATVTLNTAPATGETPPPPRIVVAPLE